MNFFFSAEHKRRYFEECWLMEIVFFFSFFLHTVEVNCIQLFYYWYSSKYLLCSAEERNSYRFGRTLGWRNDDRVLFLGVNYHFMWNRFFNNTLKTFQDRSNLSSEVVKGWDILVGKPQIRVISTLNKSTLNEITQSRIEIQWSDNSLLPWKRNHLIF